MSNVVISTEMKAHFLRLYEIALSDDDFSPLEWKMLYQFAKERDISSDELDKIFLTTNGVLTIPESYEKRIEYLYDFARLIWADGKVTEDEEQTLIKFCKKFGIKAEYIAEFSRILIEYAKEGKNKNEVINGLIQN